MRLLNNMLIKVDCLSMKIKISKFKWLNIANIIITLQNMKSLEDNLINYKTQ